MNVPRCPDKETLFGYVVGTITEDVAEVVAEHLLACRSCEQTVEALEGLSDTLVSALQQAPPSDAYAEEPACRQALQRLQALRVGGPDIDSPVASASPPPQPSRSLSRLGDYELLKKLGQGGMGTVYQAQHVRLKRVVALKVLPKSRLENTEAIARFEREVEAVGRLDHPNIVRALDAREVDGIRFLVMEHVDGLDLVGWHAVLSVGWAAAVQRVAVRHAAEEGDRPPSRCGATDHWSASGPSQTARRTAGADAGQKRVAACDAPLGCRERARAAVRGEQVNRAVAGSAGESEAG